MAGLPALPVWQRRTRVATRFWVRPRLGWGVRRPLLPKAPAKQAASRPGPSTGLARALSKLGFCSRSEAWARIQAGRVRVNDRAVLDPEWRVQLGRDRIRVDGEVIEAQAPVYLMLNKPRGLVTTHADEKDRATVFQCLEGSGASLPFVSPVGRLDQASEGLLLFTNDTAWAAAITDPGSHLEKIYHVQVDCPAQDDLMRQLERGVESEGEHLAARRVRLLRSGEKNSWLEVVLDEGKNRHLRRLLAACGVQVLRLVRVAIGPLELGSLAKGQTRPLTGPEVQALRAASRPDGRKLIR